MSQDYFQCKAIQSMRILEQVQAFLPLLTIEILKFFLLVL